MVHLIQRFTKIQNNKGSNYYKYLNQQDIYNNSEEDKSKKIVGPLKDSITTLAIGDGANDVNMITSAHIGVGIIGVEGKQAARASDYAIGEFKFLKKLLFYHGHESLRKNSFIICYNFYKNFLFVMPLFYVGFYSVFSGQTIYDPWLYQLYNIAFTVLPIIWFGIYDSERTTTESMNNPKYYYNLSTKLFNNWKFWEWIFYGIIQGFAVFFFVFSSNNIYSNNIDGEIQDFKCSGAMAYSLVIIIANFKVFQVTSVHGFLSIFFLLISIAAYYGLIYLMDIYYDMFYFGIFWRVIKNYRYYLIMGCLSLGLTFIGAGIVYIQKICSHFDNKVIHNKIMFSFKELRKKREKNNKNKNKKDKEKDNEKENININEDNKQDNNLIEEEIFENKSYEDEV
jgi:phospholipid-transporting ATPase